MSARIVTFGEIMLRLKPPGFERILQSPAFEATFGGGEANVAFSLARFGLPVSYVTLLPDNPIADAGLAFLRSAGVDTSHVVRREGRIGIYFLEAGANQRPSVVVYDRAHSVIMDASPTEIDWPEVLRGAGWFHVTGITPALSAAAAERSASANARSNVVVTPLAPPSNGRRPCKNGSPVLGRLYIYNAFFAHGR